MAKTASQYVSRNTRDRRAARGGVAELHFKGDGLVRFEGVVRKLGSENAQRAFNRAINHTAGKVQTQVVRAAAKQVGLNQSRLKQLGHIKLHKAGAGGYFHMAARIRSEGSYIPLSEFKPTQFSRGTKASPWGRRETFKGAFIHTGNWRSGQRFPSGGVFINTGRHNPRSGRNNHPRPMWGPAVPKELVKGESARAFNETSKDLGSRVAHEVGRMTKGAVS